MVFNCSFCKKSNEAVAKMIAGDDVFICGECVFLCVEILLTERNVMPFGKLTNKNTVETAPPSDQGATP